MVRPITLVGKDFTMNRTTGGRFGLPVQHSTTELTSGLMDLYGQMLIIAPNRVNPALLWGKRKGCERNYKSARIGGRSGP